VAVAVEGGHHLPRQRGFAYLTGAGKHLDEPARGFESREERIEGRGPSGTARDPHYDLLKELSIFTQSIE
jgi:hypothetical protein